MKIIKLQNSFRSYLMIYYVHRRIKDIFYEEVEYQQPVKLGKTGLFEKKAIQFFQIFIILKI